MDSEVSTWVVTIVMCSWADMTDCAVLVMLGFSWMSFITVSLFGSSLVMSSHPFRMVIRVLKTASFADL